MLEKITEEEFTDALQNYLEAGPWKFPVYTDKVYEIIFKEKSKEYRRLLQLEKKAEKTRRTFYSEIIALIASFEHAIATEFKVEI